MKNFLIRLTAFFLCTVFLALPANAILPPPDATYTVQAESVYIVNTDTNIIIYEKNSDLPVQAKGLTKLMTTALILTQYQDVLDTTMITMPSAVSDYVYNTPYADIRAGETVSLRQMLYGMLLPNGNDAAEGTAYVLSQNDTAGWVTQMNSLSEKIGTTGSTWTDASGIDAGNVTTARDMYLINRYLMGFDAYVEIMTTYLYELPANTKHASSYYITNQNKMISENNGGLFYRDAAQGAKTDVSGYSGDDHGLQSAVSWSTQGGMTYIYSVMNSPDTADVNGYATRRAAQYETTQLMDWVHSAFSIQAALDPDTPLCEVPVKYSADTDNIKLYPSDQILTILPSSSDSTVTQKIYTLPEYVTAPIKQGDIVGYVTLFLAGEELGTANLLAGQDITRNDLLYSANKLQEFSQGMYLKVVFLLTILTFAAYVTWSIVHGIKTRNSKKIRRH